MNVLFQFAVIVLLTTRLLCGLCYWYFAQHTENVFAGETRSLVRENETKEKTLGQQQRYSSSYGRGRSKDCLRNQEFALTQRNPDKNHQHQIRNALSDVEHNQLLIWCGNFAPRGFGFEKHWTFLARMFYFPIADNIMLLPRTVSLKSRAFHLHMRVWLTERQKANSLENITWSE